MFKKYITDSQKIIENAGIDKNTDLRNFTIAENGEGAHSREAAKHVFEKLNESTDVDKTLSDLADDMNKGKFC